MPLAFKRDPESVRRHRLEELLAGLEQGPAGQRPNHELREAIDKYPSQISGGQQQRMAVLRALIHGPEVVFADEPCASLDPHNAGKVRCLLSKWVQPAGPAGAGERTLVLVTHSAADAWEMASHFVLLKNGSVCENRTLTRDDLDGPDDIQRRIAPDDE